MEEDDKWEERFRRLEARVEALEQAWEGRQQEEQVSVHEKPPGCALCGMELSSPFEYHPLEFCRRFQAGEPRESIVRNPPRLNDAPYVPKHP